MILFKARIWIEDDNESQQRKMEWRGNIRTHWLGRSSTQQRPRGSERNKKKGIDS